MLKKILNKDIEGFLIISNLKIEKEACNPSFGFCPQSINIPFNWLSKDTIDDFKYIYDSNYKIKINKLLQTNKIIGLHYLKNNYNVIHTSFFIWLNEHFKINYDFIIHHVFEFTHQPFLKNITNKYINLRYNIKQEIKKSVKSTVVSLT